MSNLPKILAQDVENLAFGMRLKDTSQDDAHHCVAANTGELKLGDSGISIFNALAGDNGILDQEEVKDIQNAIGDKAQDGELDKKDVKQILAELANTYEGLRNVSWKDFYNFLFQYSAQTRNLTSSNARVTPEDGNYVDESAYCLSRNSGNSVIDEYYDKDGNLLGKEITNTESHRLARYNSQNQMVYEEVDDNGVTQRITYTYNDEGKRVYHHSNERPPMGLEKITQAPQPAIPSPLTQTKNGVSLEGITIPEPQNVEIPSNLMTAPSRPSIHGPGYDTPDMENAGQTIDGENGERITYNENGYISTIVDAEGKLIRKMSYRSSYHYEYEDYDSGMKITLNSNATNPVTDIYISNGSAGYNSNGNLKEYTVYSKNNGKTLYVIYNNKGEIQSAWSRFGTLDNPTYVYYDKDGKVVKYCENGQYYNPDGTPIS